MADVHGAEILAKVLQDHGIDRVFTLCGNHTLRIYQALHEVGIRLIDCRNEAVAAMAADAAARVTRRPAVALVTGGPGLTNALTGLVTAHGADSPLILLSGQNATSLNGRGAQQELDQAAAAEAMCKWSDVVDDVSAIEAMVGHAFDVAASGTTGAVHLALPSNVMSAPKTATHGWAAPDLPDAVVDPADVSRVAARIRRAQRPVVIAGAGAYMSRAESGLATLVDRCDIPLFTIDTARGMVPDDHRCVVGYGDPSLNPAAELIVESDCVVLLGRRLDFRLRFGDGSVINADATLIDIRNAGASVDSNRERDGVDTNIGEFLDALVPELDGYRAQDGWLERLQADNPLRHQVTPGSAVSASSPAHPEAVVHALAGTLPDDAVLVFDAGEFVQWCRTGFEATGPGRWLRVGAMSTCGAGTGLAFGAAATSPESPVILFTGDGSFGYYLSEFEAAARQGITFVAVVGNNAAWGLEQNLQEGLYGPEFVIASTLSPVRYSEAVQALGGYGEYVTSAAELPAAVVRAIKSGLPACIEIPVTPAPSPLTRAVIGRGGEV